MKNKLLNGSTGHGELTNLLRMRRVYMVTHQEGVGTEEEPSREIRTYFDEEGHMLDRVDGWKNRPKL